MVFSSFLDILVGIRLMGPFLKFILFNYKCFWGFFSFRKKNLKICSFHGNKEDLANVFINKTRSFCFTLSPWFLFT